MTTRTITGAKRVFRVGQTVQWWRDSVLMTATVLSVWARAELMLVEGEDFGVFYVRKDEVL